MAAARRLTRAALVVLLAASAALWYACSDRTSESLTGPAPRTPPGAFSDLRGALETVAELPGRERQQTSEPLLLERCRRFPEHPELVLHGGPRPEAHAFGPPGDPLQQVARAQRMRRICVQPEVTEEQRGPRRPDGAGASACSRPER